MLEVREDKSRLILFSNLCNEIDKQEKWKFFNNNVILETPELKYFPKIFIDVMVEERSGMILLFESLDTSNEVVYLNPNNMNEENFVELIIQILTNEMKHSNNISLIVDMKRKLENEYYKQSHSFMIELLEQAGIESYNNKNLWKELK